MTTTNTTATVTEMMLARYPDSEVTEMLVDEEYRAARVAAIRIAARIRSYSTCNTAATRAWLNALDCVAHACR